MMKREKELFDAMVEAGRKSQEAEINYYIARNDYKAATDNYRAEVEAQQKKKQDFLDHVEELKTHEERIMYILDNQEELLELFFCTKEILDYKSRQIDKKIKECGEEVKNNAS